MKQFRFQEKQKQRHQHKQGSFLSSMNHSNLVTFNPTRHVESFSEINIQDRLRILCSTLFPGETGHHIWPGWAPIIFGWGANWSISELLDLIPPERKEAVRADIRAAAPNVQWHLPPGLAQYPSGSRPVNRFDRKAHTAEWTQLQLKRKANEAAQAAQVKKAKVEEAAEGSDRKGKTRALN